MKRKIMSVLAACACACVAFSEMPRSEWIGKVGECVQDTAELSKVIAQLSPADQCAFLGEVNTAIAKMPGSQESKGASFLAANKAALIAASKGNRADMLAEVFATVPPEFLTIINENFAETLFSRKGDVAHTYTDDEYVEICTNTLAKVIARTSSAENSSVRNVFAILMFVNASGGTPENLYEIMADQLPVGKDIAKNEWLPAALGMGQTKSYDAMLGAAQADDEPNHKMVVQISGMQITMAMLSDLRGTPPKRSAEKGNDMTLVEAAGSAQGHFSDLGMLRIPRSELLADPRGRYYGPRRDNNGGSKRDPVVPTPTPKPTPPEPEPYTHQRIW